MRLIKIGAVLSMTIASIVMLAVAIAQGAPSYEAGKITCQAYHFKDKDSVVLECKWKTTAGAATIPAQTLPIPTVGFLIRVTTKPGGTAPTALYDIDLDDQWETDMDGTALDDRSAAAIETVDLQAAAKPNGVNIHGTPTVTITGNAVNNAEGIIIFYIRGKVLR